MNNSVINVFFCLNYQLTANLSFIIIIIIKVLFLNNICCVLFPATDAVYFIYLFIYLTLIVPGESLRPGSHLQNMTCICKASHVNFPSKDFKNKYLKKNN